MFISVTEKQNMQRRIGEVERENISLRASLEYAANSLIERSEDRIEEQAVNIIKAAENYENTKSLRWCDECGEPFKARQKTVDFIEITSMEGQRSAIRIPDSMPEYMGELPDGVKILSQYADILNCKHCDAKIEDREKAIKLAKENPAAVLELKTGAPDMEKPTEESK